MPHHRSRPRRSAALALAAAALLAGTGAGASSGASGSVGLGTEESPPEVELLDRGAAPRSELRFTVPVGTTQILTMRMYTNIGQRSGGQVFSGGSPNTTLTMSMTVTSVTEAGDLTIDLVYEDVRATDDGSPTFEQYEDAIAPVEGLTATVTMTSRGEILESAMEIPDDLELLSRQLAEQISEQLGQLSAPFPDAAVGKGARWRVSNEAEFWGFTIEQTTTFTLDRVRGSKISLSSETRQYADRQTGRIPGTIGESTLVSSNGEGRGTSEYDLTGAPTMIGGNSNVEVRQKMKINRRSLSQTIQVSMFFNERR